MHLHIEKTRQVRRRFRCTNNNSFSPLTDLSYKLLNYQKTAKGVKRNMKKLTQLALVLAMCLSLCVPAFATGTINEDSIVFTPEEIEEQISIDNQLRARASEFLPNPLLRARVEWNAPVTLRQQINTYYCGPASTQMVYEGITGDLTKNQQWFASQLGTTSAGTSSTQIANTLSQLTDGDYSVANVYTSNQDVLDVYYNIANSLQQGYAVVANIEQIPGRYNSGGHFIVVYGSMIETVESLRYLYNDPHYNNNYYGSWSISGSDMLTALRSNEGNYVRVP